MLYPTQHLVEEVGHALVVQVHLYHLAQVGIHQLHHQVDVLELLQRLLWREGIQQSDDLEKRFMAVDKRTKKREREREKKT